MRNHAPKKQKTEIRKQNLYPLSSVFRPLSPSLLVLLTVALMVTFTQIVSAKSLYVLADINGSPNPLQAYDIADDGTLTFQAEYGIRRQGIGAVGIAMDSYTGILFVTYEMENTIQLIDGTTMKGIGTVVARGARNLAGIVVDYKKKLLYCADRYTDTLYVFDWDASTATITPVPGSPFTLTGANAFGITLDEINDLLYVANNSNEIKVYNTSDWSLAETLSVGRSCVGIAIDGTRGLLYFGGSYPTSNNYYLTQYNLATDTEAEVQVEPEAGVFGITVDVATGFVYVTTGSNNKPGGDNIRVYDTALNQIDVVTAIGNPTGLVIPKEDIGYNPLHLSKNILGSETGEVTNVPIGGTITYTISFENVSSAQTLNNVSIVDTLPDEVLFITADGDGGFGQYYPDTHTYAWFYPSLSPGSQGDSLQLIVQVKNDIAPGTNIHNSVTIDSDETGPTTASVDATVTTKAISYNRLNLSKSIIKGIIDGIEVEQVEYIGAGDTIVYGIYFDNIGNDDNVNNVSIVDALPDEVSFIKADGDGEFGQYDPIKHAYIWSYSSLPPRSLGACLELTVQVNQDTAPGTTITNSVTIDSDETEPTAASVDVTTTSKEISYNPLNLSKSIIRGIVDGIELKDVESVSAGDTIVYSICFDNMDNDYTINNVSIVDSLPDGVSFVTADWDGILGQYDQKTHSYTWSYSSLSPLSKGDCLELVAQVNQGITPGMIITNLVTIDSDETRAATASVDIATTGKAISYNPLNVGKSVIQGFTEETAFENVKSVRAGDTIVYGICFDNMNNDYTIANVSIIDTLPYEVSFVTADGDGEFGQYDPITHTYIWSYPCLGPWLGSRLEIAVKVDQDTAHGTIITNAATVEGDGTIPVTAIVDVFTIGSPLEAVLNVYPDKIRRNESCAESILAIIELPLGITRDDIKDEPLILDPGNIEAERQSILGADDKPQIHAWFSAAELKATMPNYYGEVNVTVTGKLKSGRSFYGEAVIYITRFTGS